MGSTRVTVALGRAGQEQEQEILATAEGKRQNDVEGGSAECCAVAAVWQACRGHKRNEARRREMMSKKRLFTYRSRCQSWLLHDQHCATRAPGELNEESR